MLVIKLHIIFQLISLKAELLKKQEEIQEKKHLPQHNLDNFKPSQPTRKSNKSDGDKKKNLKDNLKAIDAEEFEACRKSKYIQSIIVYEILD